MVASLLTAALVGPLGAGLPSVRADPNDDKFLAALQSQGFTYRSAEAAIAVGHQICTRLDQGATKLEIAKEIIDQTGLDPFHAGYLIGASVAAYCPQYKEP